MENRWLQFEVIKKQLAPSKYTCCEFSQRELLAVAQDLFVLRYDPDRGDALKHGRYCLRNAARRLGYVRNDRIYVDITECDLSGAGESELAEVLDQGDEIARQIAMVEGLIKRFCPSIQQFWRHIRDGVEREEAAATCGLSQVDVSRMIRIIQRKLGLATEPVYRRRDKADKAGQMNLFAAA